ncbi:MAG: hypothetical protein AAB731_01280 [Patescibacteria group bacterium]
MSELSELESKISRLLPNNGAVLALLRVPEAARMLQSGATIVSGEHFDCGKVLPVVLFLAKPDGGIGGDILIVFLRGNYSWTRDQSDETRRYREDGVYRKAMSLGTLHVNRWLLAVMMRAPMLYHAMDGAIALD